ncbi:MAG TPA: serine hydrolase [Solirubrobacteraceae bacterium]|nr:serine hydrolase [Solirubrobacteraceae bacterium]
MSGSQYLDAATSRRRREAKERRRRGRRRLAVLLVALATLLGLSLFAASTGDDGGPPTAGPAAGAAPPGGPTTQQQEVLGPLPAEIDLADPTDAFTIPFKKPPKAGLVVNLDTGEVLWRRNPERRLPIASLTKMMTALVTVEMLDPDDRARITPSVLHYSGSGVGVLPKGKRVKVETLLHGLMLPSGNDAARALAFRASGSIRAFVRRMNVKAQELGLRCTRFAGIEGLSPGNRSCAVDLVAMAKHVLRTRRLARIVRRRRAILPFPIKGGKLHLYNNNPLLRRGYPGILGVKTGYTNEAGRCLVAAARRRGVTLVSVVLDSPDPGEQSRKLLDRGFRAVG